MNLRNENGEATFETIIAIMIAAILMFIVPLITLADMKDKNDQALVQSLTSEVTGNIANTGTFTKDDYNNFISRLDSTGNVYQVELEFKILDENESKKRAQGVTTVIGENTYYIVYTSTIEDQLFSSGKYSLKEGDIITVSVKNSSQTLADSLKNFFIRISGNDSSSIMGTDTQTVKANGK